METHEDISLYKYNVRVIDPFITDHSDEELVNISLFKSKLH